MDPTAATGGVNPIDVAAVAIVAFTFVFGLRSGFFPQLGGLAGAIVGAGVTLLLIPLVRDQLVTFEAPLRALIIIGSLIMVVGVGEAAGSALGSAIRERLGGGLFGNADRLAGAFLGVAQGLLVIWLAGGLLAAGPISGAAGWAQSSTAVRSLSAVLPPPTEFATSLGHLLDASGLPQLFVGLEPFPAKPVDTPSTAEARRISAAAVPSTVKVIAQACSFDLTGTGFSVGRGYYVTNAHVVAGGTREQIAMDGGSAARATVVLFDPTLDIAVLYAPSMTTPALQFATRDPARGATAAALGHPFGEPLVVIPVGVSAAYPAQGLDIYGDTTVTRQILELSANIDKGDSGGPLVLEDGTIGGVVFAESKNDPTVGYALAASAVATRVTSALKRTTAVSTGPCVH
ncbi:MAG TPA: MarP family serine protease [Candidatus Acidoferrum sp.]|nr:MarP family serine protease [Candidatus Acidoferrum sp.]